MSKDKSNNLQQRIEEILERFNFDDAWYKEATEAIMSEIEKCVPEAQKDYNGKELSTDFDNYEAGYNQCRLDILKELGGGNE